MNRKRQQAFGIPAAVQVASMLSAAPLMDGIALARGHSASSDCDRRLTRLTANRQWGSALLGGSRRYDLSYRFQHLSNAGLFPPGKGINYHLIPLGIRL